MILNNVKIAGTDQPVNVHVNNDKITDISSLAFTGIKKDLQLTFNNALIFPGLINSHDHLDFNLFPQFGNRTYNNYTEWGKHIHKTYKAEITGILKIPFLLRVQWGIYKNLLCGVTTVVNHGKRLGLDNDLITVFEETYNLHSVHFEKRWRAKLNNPFKKTHSVVIHAGEGTDMPASREIDKLTSWNLFNKRLIAVHAVSMSASQAEKFKAIVWCPQSNYFLLGKTAPIGTLEKNTATLFGTDSTLTSSWDIWQHLKLARNIKMLKDESLYNMLNHNPAEIWQLNCGQIATGKDADLVIAKAKEGKNGFEAFFAIVPADLILVMHKGNIRLFDETLLTQLKGIDLSDFSTIYVGGICKYIKGNLPGLLKRIKQYNSAVNFPVSLTKPIDKVKLHFEINASDNSH